MEAKKMGDAYNYFSIMNEGQPNEYFRLYNDGKVIEHSRTIYLEGLDMPVSIYDIVEIRIGGTTLRFINNEGNYFVITRDKVLFSISCPEDDTGVIL